ncbi:TPA: tRNA-intron lyase [Candidatus Bathyarchaeota archaeon]|nr:tRNA-intron lyase [Candidatus Bathyarchaeota archaeon]HIJ07993.1 tRNA-intron lyase [Candidatus Bathyarchaeota archaeon]
MNERSSEATSSEIKAKGLLTEKGVQISERSSIDALCSRGYGTTEKETFRLTFYEALYLLDKEQLEVFENKTAANFQTLLQCYQEKDENAWVNYLVYRDLRTRGYVVREGFGVGTDFRIYERGAYGKDTAQFLVLSIQEGKPLPIEDLKNAMKQCQSQKKELIIAVMNRRGETVYYSVSPLTFK